MKLQQAIGHVIARRKLTAALLLGICAGAPTVASADEGGVSFWLPGTFGSLAAAPQQPGWSFAGIYYHTSVSAGGDVAARARGYDRAVQSDRECELRMRTCTPMRISAFCKPATHSQRRCSAVS